MSQRIQFSKTGGPEVLELVEVDVGAPGPDEVRVRQKACGGSSAYGVTMAPRRDALRSA